jgi:hypothetical protein
VCLQVDKSGEAFASDEQTDRSMPCRFLSLEERELAKRRSKTSDVQDDGVLDLASSNGLLKKSGQGIRVCYIGRGKAPAKSSKGGVTSSNGVCLHR